MKRVLCLFCGGNYGLDGMPKPLVRFGEGNTLLWYYLKHIEQVSKKLPDEIILLCDDDHENHFLTEASLSSFGSIIQVIKCGNGSSTFQKVIKFLSDFESEESIVELSYPDIFDFELPDIELDVLRSNIIISSANIKSRFPRMSIDIYTNTVNGITDYTSPVPSNPLYVYGGHVFSYLTKLKNLVDEFTSNYNTKDPNFEYDFLFWLINKKILHSTSIQSSHLLIDSNRDFEKIKNLYG